jgi:hypothetical protein
MIESQMFLANDRLNPKSLPLPRLSSIPSKQNALYRRLDRVAHKDVLFQENKNISLNITLVNYEYVSNCILRRTYYPVKKT